MSTWKLNAGTRLVVVVVIVKKQQDPSHLNHKKIAERGTKNIHFIAKWSENGQRLASAICNSTAVFPDAPPSISAFSQWLDKNANK